MKASIDEHRMGISAIGYDFTTRLLASLHCRYRRLQLAAIVFGGQSIDQRNVYDGLDWQIAIPAIKNGIDNKHGFSLLMVIDLADLRREAGIAKLVGDQGL